jgi:hypothetical protein
MSSAFRITLAAFLLGGSLAVATQPAAAKKQQVQAPAPGRQFRLTKEERAALAPLQAAVDSRSWAAAAAALPAAQAGARGSDARYIVARLQLRMASETRNGPMQSQAIDALVASGGATPEEMAALVGNQAALLANTGSNLRTEAAYARLVQLEPNNAEALANLAKIKNDLLKPAEAVSLLDRAIAVREAAGNRPPESWYRFALRLAVDTKLAPQASKLARGLVGAYPSGENWRDALLAYVDLSRPGDPLDAWRLMRAAKALAGERDFLQFAQAANNAGLAAEAKAVLDEGVARRMIDPGKTSFRELIASSGRKAAADRAGLGAREAAAMAAATGATALSAGDAFLASGDYAKAAALYAAARQKGGVDDAVASLRLGEALALAGRRAEAETAFRGTSGGGSELAGLWLILLRQPA